MLPSNGYSCIKWIACWEGRFLSILLFEPKSIRIYPQGPRLLIARYSNYPVNRSSGISELQLFNEGALEKTNLCFAFIVDRAAPNFKHRVMTIV